MSTLEASSTPDCRAVVRGAALTVPLVAVAWKRLSAPPSRPAGLATLTRVILPAALPATVTVPSAPIATWSSVVPLGRVTGGSSSAPSCMARRPCASICRLPSRVSERWAPAHLHVAGALDGDVERAAGLLGGALGVVAADHGRRGAGADAQGGGRSRGALVVGEVAVGHADVLVARGARIGEIVGHGIEPALLRGHTGRCGVHAFQHLGETSIRRGLRSRRSSQRTLLSSEVVGRCAQALARTSDLLAGEGADLRGGLLQRRVDRRDRTLGGLEGAHGGHEVDHRAGRVDARALQGAGADLAGGLAAGLPVKMESPCLTGLRTLKSATLVGSIVPLADRDGLAAAPRTWLPSWSTSLPWASAVNEPLRV